MLNRGGWVHWANGGWGVFSPERDVDDVAAHEAGIRINRILASMGLDVVDMIPPSW